MISSNRLTPKELKMLKVMLKLEAEGHLSFTDIEDAFPGKPFDMLLKHRIEFLNKRNE